MRRQIRPLQAEFRFTAILLNSAAMKTSKRTFRRTCTRIVASVRHKNQCVQLLAFLLLAAAPLVAHPMGNFSVNHYSKITLTRAQIELLYIIDMAEIPTFQDLQAAGLKADPADPHISAYLRSKADEFWRGLMLKLDGQPVELECAERQVIFPPGAGGLPTMKFGFTCRAPLTTLSSSQHRLEFRDDNFPGRAGWKEVIVHADPALQLVSNAPDKDRSAELSNYPTDLLNSPPQDLSANATFMLPAIASPAHSALSTKKVAAPAANATISAAADSQTPTSKATTGPETEPPRLSANTQGTPRSAFTQLIASDQLSLWFFLTAALIAMGLGALHALEPGHGKTLVAAYLVGSRGTAWHAVLLGIIVTVAHTAGVYALGAVTLYASRYVLPEKLYPWLGAISGLIIVVLGIWLFLRRWVGHDPSLAEDHTHWYDALTSRSSDAVAVGGDGSAAAPARQPVATRQLLILGITGGLVPCPAALVVLLSAVAMHRIALGFYLIVAFSVGLAAVLIAIGLLMVHAGRFLSRLHPNSELVRRRLPLLSAVFITVVGVVLVVQSLKPAGFVSVNSFASPKWLLVAGIGLLLGMRHSTDPDHVIAVTTIVTRLRTLRHASFVGMLWGVGHTLTIFIVGSAIILFDLVIPPRIGLSMEFAVALMLIVLGVLNLTGVLAWFTRRATPASAESQGVKEARAAGSNSERLLDRVLSRFGTYQLVRPLVIGIVHGLAGSAAVALLVLATIHNPVWAIGYLLLFGLGTIAGMMLMTAVIAMPVVWTGKSFVRLNRYMCATSGIVSVAFGLFLVYQIGFVSGLFSAAPKWIPG
jgi:ABC-type nickel/cobalt efflux system permease component RcnA